MTASSDKRLFVLKPIPLALMLVWSNGYAAQTQVVSLDNAGNVADKGSYAPSLSQDGRFVAFTSAAGNLPRATGVTQIYLRDRSTGQTVLVSAGVDGEAGNVSSTQPHISADGRFVAFASAASNLVAGDNNGKFDIFVRDLQSGTTQRVSVSNTGGEGNGNSLGPSTSGDGRYVVFVSEADNLVAGDTNAKRDIFIHDRINGTTLRVGPQGNDHSYVAAISTDGGFVAFSSSASNLVGGDTNGAMDIFVWDRQSGATERVSVASNGAEGNGNSLYPAISGDGRFVTFGSAATNFAGGDNNGLVDAFLHDRQTGTTIPVSGGGNDFSNIPVISANGRFVAFVSRSTNLVGGDANGKIDVFVYDRLNGTTELATVSGSGTQANADVDLFIAVSGDGKVVGFASAATNLVANDTNNVPDVFVRVRDVINQKPVASAGADQIKECNAGGATFVLDASGSYDLEGDTLSYTWSGTFGTVTGPSPTVTLGLGTHTINLTVSDGNGGSVSDSMIVTVTDTTPPTVAAGPDVALEAVAIDGAPFDVSYNASDSCGPISMSVAPTPARYPLGTTDVSVTAVDGSGNSASDTVRVKVTDTTPPTLTAPADVSGEATGAQTPVSIGNASANDIFPVTVSNNAPAAYPLGTTTVTWAATDSNGNRSSATQKVTLRDTTAPLLTPPPDKIAEATGAVTAVNFGTATASDAFPVTITHDAPSGFPLGATAITWTATDANGNAASATQTITVVDTTAPTLTGPAAVSVEATGPQTTVNLGDATASDAFAVTITNDAPAQFPVGTTMVTWTATDANGNTASATQQVTVRDTAAPQLNVPADITVEANGVLSTVAIGMASAIDVVDGAVTVSGDAPKGFPVGETLITYTATDSHGNTATASQRVTVVDTTAPVLTAPPNITVEAAGPTMAVDIGVATTKDIFGVTVVNNAPAAFALGATLVQWTATDANGNVSHATQTITVVDTTPPVVDAGPDVTVEAIDVSGAPFALQYNVSDVCACGPVNVAISPKLDVYPLGTTTVTITATDGSGNKAAANRKVTVVDTTPPVLTPPPSLTVEATGVQTAVNIGIGTASDIFPVAVVNNAPPIFGLGTTAVTWMATDANGNIATASQSITVIDTTAPTFDFAVLKDELWPPRFDMVLAATVSNVSDVVDAAPTVDIVVTSNGDHPRKPHKEDWKIEREGDQWEIWLRAERLIKPRQDRVYDIQVTVSDAAGNQAQAAGQVTVPAHHPKHDDAERGKERHEMHHDGHRKNDDDHKDKRHPANDKNDRH